MGERHDPAPKRREVLRAAARSGLTLDIVVTAQSARTAEEAALACGCDVGQIVKSVAFRGATRGQPLLLLVSGRNRVDEARAAEAAGEAIARPDAAFVRRVTGFAIGGIPPFGHDEPMRTLLDETLLAYPVLWAAAGTPNTVFAIAPATLRQVTGASVVALT